MTIRILLAAHLIGLSIGVATIVSLVPGVTKLLRMLV